MAQDTTWSGAVLTESDINAKLMHESSTFGTFTPTLTQSATITKTVTYGAYARAARLINGTALLLPSSSGTANNAVVVGLPVATHASLASLACIGSGYWYDASTGFRHAFVLLTVSSTTCQLVDCATAVANVLGQTGSSNGAAVASSDVISYNFHYEAAT